MYSDSSINAIKLTMIGAALLMLLTFLNSTIQKEVVENIPIVSLSNSSEITGEFHGILTIQSGKINEKEYYRFRIKNEKTGRSVYRKLLAADTEIIEYSPLSGESPHLEIVWVVSYLGDSMIDGNLFNPSDQRFKGYSQYTGIVKKITIVTEEGTINNNFSVNFND